MPATPTDWIREIESRYAAETACQFLLYGNVRAVFQAAPAEPSRGIDSTPRLR